MRRLCVSGRYNECGQAKSMKDRLGSSNEQAEQEELQLDGRSSKDELQRCEKRCDWQ